jgi:NADP-dependent aldehyde dehydrogenase
MATADYVADAITRAAKKTGMPDGVFSLLYGSVGEALVKHPSIQAVGFTGSLRGGRALCDMAAARPQPIPVFAEMSSINPVLLMPEALKVRGDKIATELAASVVLGAGQFCTNPGLVLGIRSPEFSAFLERFAALMGEQPSQTMLNAGALKSYCHGLDNLRAHSGMTHLAGAEQQGNQARPQLFKADVSLLISGDELLQEEVFGPTTIVVEIADQAELLQALHGLRGQLTATLIAENSELNTLSEVLALLEQKVGRVLFNGYPTGVEVGDAMVHGGPYPATSDARGTSVGTLAIDRFLRPVCFQNCPDSLLPQALQNANPLGINRLVDGVSGRDAL